jgi:hypothetical protein
MMDQNKIELFGDQITKKKKTKLMVYNKMSELERKWELPQKTLFIISSTKKSLTKKHK